MKRLLALASGISTLILMGMNYIGTFFLCGGKEYGSCMDTTAGTIEALIPVMPFFLFSLITYKMPEKVWRAWMYFALPWTALSIILVFLTPEYSGGGFGPSLNFGKSDIALIMSALFCVISILLIGGMYLRVQIGKK